MEDATYIDVLDRLKEATGATSDQDLAVKLNLSKQSIADARSRKTVPPAWIPKTAQIFGVSTDWLFFGREPMRGNAQQAQPLLSPSDSAVTDDEGLIRIPMAEAILSAGTGSLETSGKMGREYAFRRDFILRKGNPANMVLMRIRGDSMQPEVMDKDMVLLDQSKIRLQPGPIFAVGIEEAIYLKRVDMLPGQIVLKSVNPAYDPIYIDMGEQMSDLVRVIGQVLWVCREYN